MEDEVIKKYSVISDLKNQDLNKLSINELQERILSLKEEINRSEEKIEIKKLSKSNAEIEVLIFGGKLAFSKYINNIPIRNLEK